MDATKPQDSSNGTTGDSHYSDANDNNQVFTFFLHVLKVWIVYNVLQVKQVDAYTNSEQLSKLGKQKEIDGVFSPSNTFMGNVCKFLTWL